MSGRVVILLGGILLPVACVAGQIYGTIREGNRPVRNATVVVQCGSDRGEGRSDQAGSYRVFVRQNGRCTLQLDAGGQRVELRSAVFSYQNPVRYDLELLRTPNGFELRRR